MLETGLTVKEAKSRLKSHGLNVLKMKRRKPLILQFLEEFKDLMVVILIIAAVFALAAGEARDGSVILFIVLLNAIIGFTQKFKAEKAVAALKKLVSPRAKVLRNGEIKDIKAKFLVPGDVMLLAEGDLISADGKILEEDEIEIDESTLTGESVPAAKSPDQKVFMGTTVAYGSAKVLVEKTGMETRFGKIAHLTTATKKDQSPLEKELHKIGVFVGKKTLLISGILLLVGMIFQDQSFVHSLLFATAVAVAAVPEGLPATITIALALGVQRLAKKNAIVKQLSSVETLGATTVICSDKTGTLTKNVMTVREIFSFSGKIFLKGNNIKKEGNVKSITSLVAKIFTICNDSTIQKKKKGFKVIGDPTEGALHIATIKLGRSAEQIRKKIKVLKKFPFDSIRKCMSVIIKEGRIHFVLTKGAPDTVIEKCTHIIINGKKEKLDPSKKRFILKQNEKMAKKALRVLALAYKETSASRNYDKTKEENGLTFIGLTGMIDPPRPEVKEAIRRSKEAGIRTYIVTGDHGLTAFAIAQEIGLAEKDTQIITGDDLEKMNTVQLKKLLKNKSKSIIFARTKPEHKLKIVDTLKKLGEVVAVTGDGVNDAPALKRSDIGVAMGIAGTDVSREAANMVLANDSFSTIIIAIEEGRKIYTNLKKFVFYIFSCNIGELLTVFTGIILGLPAPLTAVLILAVDLGTDVLPAIALGIDTEEKGIMQAPPRNPKEKIMNMNFIGRFVFLGVIIGATVITTFIWSLKTSGSYIKASTMAFVILVMIQMVNAFNARSRTKSVFKPEMKSNGWLIGAIAISIILTISFVEIPLLQTFLGTTSLDLKEWLIVLVGGFSVLVAEEIRKLFTKKIYA
jgi:P-type Ca2+ transporter type 2C